MANLVAKAFSNTNTNRNKPDLFSLIQKGIQLQSANSGEGKNFPSTETKENLQQQAGEEATKSASGDLPSKELVGLNLYTPNFITSMLRMVGFDAAKLGALAINALIMIATAVSVKSKYSFQNDLFSVALPNVHT